MSAPTARLGDFDTGHNCWPPRPNIQGASTRFVEGLPVHCQTHAWAPHTCISIPQTHDSQLATGSPTVFTEGLQTGRVGDMVACGSTVATGASTHLTGP